MEVSRRLEYFRQHQLDRADRVFIGYGNRLEFFADILAVWHLGGTAVPIDARFSPFEIETLIGAATPRLFLHQEIFYRLVEKRFMLLLSIVQNSIKKL